MSVQLADKVVPITTREEKVIVRGEADHHFTVKLAPRGPFVDEILKLYDYAMDEKNLIKDYKGNNAVKIRAKMFAAQSSSGNPYMKMVISDYQKPNEEEF